MQIFNTYQIPPFDKYKTPIWLNFVMTVINIFIKEVRKELKDLPSIPPKDEQKPSQPSSSSTGDNMEKNIFSHVFSFIEEFSIDALATAFRRVYPKIAGSFQLEQEDQQSRPIGIVEDMSFELDQGNTDSANDDLDLLDIVISDDTSHQSQQVATPPQTPFRCTCKKEQKLKQKAETADFFINKASPDQKKLFLQSSLEDLEASGNVSKPKPTPIAKEKKTKHIKDTEEKATYIITGYQPTGLALANVNDIIIYDISSTWKNVELLYHLEAWSKVIFIKITRQKKYNTIRLKLEMNQLCIQTWNNGA
ncbi:unnamed protein product [Rhizophagus irregularis]|nr:unnamed protein product [Rhizophagus irregularis]